MTTEKTIDLFSLAGAALNALGTQYGAALRQANADLGLEGQPELSTGEGALQLDLEVEPRDDLGVHRRLEQHDVARAGLLFLRGGALCFALC